MRLVDTHAHIHMPHFDNDRETIIQKFENDNMEFIINVGTDLDDSRICVELANKYKKIFASVGVHPHDSKDTDNEYLNRLKKLAVMPKVVAIGEIGLDYYRNFSPKEIQQKVFAEQLLLAKELNLPIIVHIREAFEDAYNILETIGIPEKGGVVHSFSGNTSWAIKFLKLGLLIGISGPVTYRRNHSLRETVQKIGENNILPETDCPYLPPQPVRGKRNEPVYVKYIFNQINDIIGRDVSEILIQNAVELFGVNI
ncbi:TatD family hydrolase [Thermosipho ferrireducens]|uniref:TatD family hydrolase n=1 Tax=Thermosipho ferrireducens TaxID=2571116 RepID=A0ABX7S7N1_9BACT|nr:TatD family hydrolase [Thermosipho ferrireducens]QTA38587.1 TatD family hydrolase [Thermosipho ferrireducens]